LSASRIGDRQHAGLPERATLSRKRGNTLKTITAMTSLDELAAVGSLSPYYLIRRFQRELGLPPHAYQLQIRLQRAKADLQSDASLAGVAIKHGFFDQSHFHRHFKRAFGVSPGRYREAWLEKMIQAGRRTGLALERYSTAASRAV
jgi:AraC-like DNA-binding protein